MSIRGCSVEHRGHIEYRIEWNSSGSVADPGCSFLIPDPNLSSRIQGRKDSGYRTASKNFIIFNPKNCYLSSWKYDNDFFHPGSRGQKYHRIPDRGSESAHLVAVYSVCHKKHSHRNKSELSHTERCRH
jgi:hypothetical protein